MIGNTEFWKQCDELHEAIIRLRQKGIIKPPKRTLSDMVADMHNSIMRMGDALSEAMTPVLEAMNDLFG